MDVLGYTILEEESLPGFLKGRPHVALCLTCAAALLLVTALSITIGIFIGYTYCYLEHRSGAIKGYMFCSGVLIKKDHHSKTNESNVTRTNIKIMPMPVYESLNNKTRTINDALLNNFISNLLRVSGVRRESSLTGNEVKELPETTA